MTPAARIAAAIEILDTIQDGQAAEQVLTRWGRQNRYAGSKDRAAVRDHVFDVLRVRATAEHLGQGHGGRALMIGLLRHQGRDPAAFFTGEGHAPALLSDEEQALPDSALDQATLWNIPTWLQPHWQDSLGPRADVTAELLGQRAPVTLRINAMTTSRDAICRELEGEGVRTTPNPLAHTALTVLEGARRVRQSRAYQEGRVELQDAASQAVVDLAPDGKHCLDYCAGGGGKSLALFAQGGRSVFAYDIDADRMRDLPQRAKRAGASIRVLTKDQLAKQAPFDVILCDAPCSGSGAWRRSPEGKWHLTQQRLDELTAIQDDILRKATSLLAPGGCLVYATCSVLRCENEDRISQFLQQNPDFSLALQQRFDVSEHGDGFFTAHLTQE